MIMLATPFQHRILAILEGRETLTENEVELASSLTDDFEMYEEEEELREEDPHKFVFGI